MLLCLKHHGRKLSEMIRTKDDVVNQTATIAPLEQHREIEVQDANHIISLAPIGNEMTWLSWFKVEMLKKQKMTYGPPSWCQRYTNRCCSQKSCARCISNGKQLKQHTQSHFISTKLLKIPPTNKWQYVHLHSSLSAKWVNWGRAFWTAHKPLSSDLPDSASKGMQVRVSV